MATIVSRVTLNWTDNGSITPSGALPSVDTSGSKIIRIYNSSNVELTSINVGNIVGAPIVAGYGIYVDGSTNVIADCSFESITNPVYVAAASQLDMQIKVNRVAAGTIIPLTTAASADCFVTWHKPDATDVAGSSIGAGSSVLKPSLVVL
jgi:hypothetical protein